MCFVFVYKYFLKQKYLYFKCIWSTQWITNNVEQSCRPKWKRRIWNLVDFHFFPNFNSTRKAMSCSVFGFPKFAVVQMPFFVFRKSIFKVFWNVFEHIVKVLYFVFTSIAEKYFVFVFKYFIVNLFCICILIHLESILPKSAISIHFIMLKNGSVLCFDLVFFAIFKPYWGIACYMQFWSVKKKLDRTNFNCLLFGFVIAVFALYKYMHSKC